jgi:hypothetical protein
MFSVIFAVSNGVSVMSCVVWYLIAGEVQSSIENEKNMNACTDGDGCFCFQNSPDQNWSGGKIKSKNLDAAGRQRAGRRFLHYTATLWKTLEGTAKRAEKERERLSGSSTHASPSSKFCA